jgi:hypothetical protein
VKYSYLLLAFLIPSLLSCKKNQLEKVQYYFNAPLPKDVRDIHLTKVQLSADYIKPYSVYINFKTSVADFDSLIQSLHLINKEDDIFNKMCLTNVDLGFINNLWSFKTKSNLEATEEFKKNNQWWTPNKFKNLDLFGSFYVENEKGIENCYGKHWDGRILLGYNKTSQNVYILIEIFM